jgi:chromosome segregation ATPase
MDTSEDNDYQVLMSPLLSNKIDSMSDKVTLMEEKLNRLEDKLDKILEKDTNIESILQENKKIYISLMKQNQKLSQKNMEILNSNRKAYVEALEKLDSNETEVIEILEKLEKDNKDFASNNISSESRIYNRYWRSSGINTIMKPLSADLISKIGNNK